MNKNSYFGQQLILVILLLIFSGNLALGNDILTDEERSYLIEKGTIVFVSQSAYPPFEYVEQQGDHIGMSIEMARWMATEFEFKAQLLIAKLFGLNPQIIWRLDRQII